MKSGNLNFLEPSGPLRACNGTALPLPFTHLCYGPIQPQGHSAAEGITSTKNSDYAIWESNPRPLALVAQCLHQLHHRTCPQRTTNNKRHSARSHKAPPSRNVTRGSNRETARSPFTLSIPSLSRVLTWSTTGSCFRLVCDKKSDDVSACSVSSTGTKFFMYSFTPKLSSFALSSTLVQYNFPRSNCNKM